MLSYRMLTYSAQVLCDFLFSGRHWRYCFGFREKGKPFIGKIGNIVVNLLARNNTSSQFLS